MSEQPALVAEKYPVACHRCGRDFDALRASWCSCLTADRSVACPGCGACLCSAGQANRSKFWAEAPGALWRRRPEAREAPRGADSLEPAERGRPVVLVVDDDRLIRVVAARVVASAGYGVLLAENGAHGLALARLHKPALVLSDALMPKIDGRKMCLQLKEDPETAGIKVVIMTSLYTKPQYMTEATHVFRADGYLCKPVTEAKLREALDRHIGSSPARPKI